MTDRQRAEIQLEAIINDPMTSNRHVIDAMEQENISISDAAKMLNTQTFILERVVRAVYKSDKKELSRSEVERLTRALNGTLDIRTLLFFIMLDESDDRYVTSAEVAEFYQTYLKGIKSFDMERSEEVVNALLHKFHLDEVRWHIFELNTNSN